MTRTTHKTHDIAREAEAIAVAAQAYADAQEVRAKRIRKGTMRTKAAEIAAVSFEEEYGQPNAFTQDLSWADPNEHGDGDEAIQQARMWAIAHPEQAKAARDRANTAAKDAAKEAKEARGRADRARAHAERYGYEG